MPDAMVEARRLLHYHFGYPDFRPAQAGVIRSVLAGRDTLAILPTGGGKSICFQIPALVRGGLTVVVSPLIALMQDQVAAARARGIQAAGMHSALDASERTEIWNSARAGSLRLLYVSPERLRTLAPELTAAGIRPTLLAIDEAHCVAEWGHDFPAELPKLGLLAIQAGPSAVRGSHRQRNAGSPSRHHGRSALSVRAIRRASWLVRSPESLVRCREGRFRRRPPSRPSRSACGR